MLINIYMVCLIVGVLYSMVSLVANGILDSLDFDFDFDLLSLPLKPFTIMTFITVFGGTGLIASRMLPPIVTLIPSVLMAYVVSFLLYNLIYVKLRKYETEASKEADAMYQEAEIVERILPNGYGKISFVINSNILSGVAKEYTPGNGIPKATKVYIIDIKNNIYYVSENLEHLDISPSNAKHKKEGEN